MTFPVVALVGLDEAISELKSTLREMVSALLVSSNGPTSFNYGVFYDYDPTQFMAMVIQDIKAAFHEASQTDAMRTFLLSQGASYPVASYLSIEIPKLVVDAIAASFPNLSYGELSCDCFYEYLPPNAIAVRFPIGMEFF